MTKKDLKKLIGTDINKYTITRYISSGSFGDVFEGKNKQTGELVALKIPVQLEERDGQRSVLDEAKIYKYLADPDNGVANMKVITAKDRKIMVMDLLGTSLETLMAEHKTFGLKTVITLAIKMIDCIKYIHSKGFLHRDLKPDNFTIGYTDPQKIFCIDYGLAKRFIRKNGTHISFCEDKRFCGTVRYASIAAHKFQEQGRKDDLEALGYILIYLYKGKLPWQGLKHRNKKEKYRIIGERKENTTEEDLCSNMPKEFCVFLKYVRNMDFDEKPHYSALRKMFVKLYESRGYKNDALEWEK